MTWKRLPDEYQGFSEIDITCDNAPHGKNALVEVWYDSHYCHRMHFSNGESAHVKRDDDGLYFQTRDLLLGLGLKPGDQLVVSRPDRDKVQQVNIDLSRFKL